jgi:NAD(P)-dependent dehydrogenase (short-subunit alcohol dehydrogenase family)
MRFQDHVIIVTGASQGIGWAAAAAFAREGAKVALISNDVERGEQAARDLAETGAASKHFFADVAREDHIQQMVDAVIAEWGRLDVLVNNAGIYLQGDVTQTTLKDWERIMSVNLTSAFLCTHYTVPIMARAGGGAIVNVASEAGLVGIKGQVVYNVSKAGMIALTRSCAVDLADRNIRVNCVCPGTTDTPLVREAVNRAPDPVSARKNLEQVRPANRLGKPEEIASAILFLASAEAAYATGAVLSIDGGYTAQ